VWTLLGMFGLLRVAKTVREKDFWGREGETEPVLRVFRSKKMVEGKGGLGKTVPSYELDEVAS